MARPYAKSVQSTLIVEPTFSMIRLNKRSASTALVDSIQSMTSALTSTFWPG
jgi:hypothetical protein